jgi:integrase
MARKTSGAVVEHRGKDGRTWRAIRFTAGGKRRYESLGPVSPGEAETALRHVLADVERGTWRPRKEVVQAAAEPERVPTFHEFAEQWWLLNERRLAENTRADYRWRLAHLLPTFASYRLHEITPRLVDQYIAAKLAEQEPLSASSINKTVKLMAQILEGAVEDELIARNPAMGKRRRVRERAPARTFLDTAEQIEALLAAAGELDAEARRDRQHISRRAMLTTLVLSGLRIGELCALRWRDVDLAAGWLHVGQAKTDAGRRRVKLRGSLRDELAMVRATQRAHGDPDDYVFSTKRGGRPSRENIRNRVLATASERANEQLVASGLSPLPHLTPHSLRRTFASLLYALGEDPPTVMSEMGHTTPALALAIYAQSMRRDPGEKARLRALVEGGVPNGDLATGLSGAGYAAQVSDRRKLAGALEQLVDAATMARVLALIPPPESLLSNR